MKEAIVAEGLGKRYDIGGHWRAFVGKARAEDEFWALSDVSFAIQPGEAVGIVGQNGAGKSTLLKILSRITAPTTGGARVRGRVATILEIGTGFHPELTGLENIFLGGALLGLGNAEIRERLEEIVAFAEIRKFLDVPVKRYSSGMYVRLAFAVAAHLQPDILIVDEVLAVGDAAFQKKCLEKMGTSVKQEARSILFVSHNLEAVRHLCSRALLFENGKLTLDASVAEVLSTYARSHKTEIDLSSAALANRKNRAAARALISELVLGDPKPINPWTFKPRERFRLFMKYQVTEAVQSLSFCINIARSIDQLTVTTIKETISSTPLAAGSRGEVHVTVPELLLRPGEYALRISLGNEDFSVNEDLLDGNVNLPHMIINSDEPDFLRRVGLIDMPYEIHHSGR